MRSRPEEAVALRALLREAAGSHWRRSCPWSRRGRELIAEVAEAAAGAVVREAVVDAERSARGRAREAPVALPLVEGAQARHARLLHGAEPVEGVEVAREPREPGEVRRQRHARRVAEDVVLALEAVASPTRRLSPCRAARACRSRST